jgi:hypothetical protein
MLQTKFVEKSKHFMFNKFFSEKCAVYEIMCKNEVYSKRPQITYYGSCALHAG